MEQRNRRMLQARDRMDRTFAEPLDIPTLASVAGCSEAHFIRTFSAVFGETPHLYLQRRRVERAMHLLREGRSVTDVCFDVGCNSLGTFSRTFRATFGETPHRYLQRRRVERAMFFLRATDRSVTDICLDVGFSSLGTFSRTFHGIVGESPSAFRARGRAAIAPTCFVMAWTRPSSFGEATSPRGALE